jgi:hypothetical protein
MPEITFGHCNPAQQRKPDNLFSPAATFKVPRLTGTPSAGDTAQRE